MRRKPFSVVLFDEIEKAHPDVFNTLLQILEEGRLTDTQGRSVDFRNTVLIMTSNLGTADLRKANLGFTKADEAVSYERMKEKVNDALKEHFRPEFLNRIDDTIVFHELSKAEVTQIVDLMIKRVTEQLVGPGPRARAHRAKRSTCWPTRATTPRSGLGRCAGPSSALVEDPLSERLLWKEFRAGETIIVDTEDDPESRQADHHLPFHRGLRTTSARGDGRGRAQRLTLGPSTAETQHPNGTRYCSKRPLLGRGLLCRGRPIPAVSAR